MQNQVGSALSGHPLRSTADTVLEEWGARVRANAAQVEMLREDDPNASTDFYASVARLFRGNARTDRQDDPTLDCLLALARPGETWLDVGAGGGRYAFPLAAGPVREVIALDPSEGMLAVLRAGIAEAGLENVRTVQARWPVEEPEAFLSDVALISHVGYDVEAIGPFLDALERAARRLCVAVLLERPPTAAMDALWPEVHGVARASLPALPEFLALLLARGRQFEIHYVQRVPQTYATPDEVARLARRQLWTRPGSEKDQRLHAVLAKRVQEREGRFALSWEPARVGVVTWQPG